MKKLPFKREFSAGGVVYKKLKIKNEKLKIVFLLGKHSGYHKWVLPKGLIEEGERGWQTALREVKEEMGVKAKLASEKPIHKETYFYIADFKGQSQISNDKFLISKQIPSTNDQNPKQSTRRVEKYKEEGGGKMRVFKTVTFYLMEYVSGDPANHGWEMEEAGWFAYEEALKLMAFKGEKEALEKAREIILSAKLSNRLL